MENKYTYEDYKKQLTKLRFDNDKGIALVLGCTNGNPEKTPIIYLNERLPSALLVGRPGGGKSCLIDAILESFADKYTQKDMRLVYLEPKNYEYWSRHQHPLALWPEKNIDVGAEMLKDLLSLAETRLKTLYAEDVSRSLYNKKYAGVDNMPNILLVLHEANALYSEEFDILRNILRIGRQVGIYCFIGTTGISDRMRHEILSDMYLRLCLQTDEKTSELMLGNNAANRMPGKGWVISSRHGVQVTTRVPLLLKDYNK